MHPEGRIINKLRLFLLCPFEKGLLSLQVDLQALES